MKVTSLVHYVRLCCGGVDRRVIGAATKVVVGILTVALLAGVAPYFTRAQIWNAEFEKLNAIAAEVLHRSEQSSDQVRAAIHDLQSQDAPPCSAQNLALMAQINLKYDQLQGVGYVANDRLMCSSYGRHGEGILLPPPTYYGISGGRIMLRKVNLSLSGNVGPQPVIVVTEVANGYSAIVSPALPIDVYTKDPNVAVGTVVYSSNQVRTARGVFDPAWRNRLDDNSWHAEFVEHDRIVSLWRSPKYNYFAFSAIPADHARARIFYAGAVIASCAAFAIAVLVWVTVRLSRQELPISEHIREAIRRKEFYLVYQPVVDLKTGRWVGAEALLRWRRSTGEQMRSDIFIPAAEQANLIEEITDHVLELAAADLAGFFEKYPNFHIAINVSSAEMQSPGVVPRLKEFIAQVKGASARNFIIEATERSLISPEKARVILAEMRGLGSSIAIDDFGTGFSSLSYLQTLSVDYLKIDKSFVDAIDTASVKNSVVPHIIGMAKDLQLQLIAEGVENADQADYLRDHGVEYAQGWHFAKAMAFDELLGSLNRQAA